MDRYTIQGHSIVLGLMLGWLLIIGFIHWTDHGVSLDGDKGEFGTDRADQARH